MPFSICVEVAATGDKPVGRCEKSSNRNLKFSAGFNSPAVQDLSA